MTVSPIPFNRLARASFFLTAVALVPLGQIWLTNNPFEIAMDVLAPVSLIFLSFSKRSSDRMAKSAFAASIALCIFMLVACAHGPYMA